MLFLHEAIYRVCVTKTFTLSVVYVALTWQWDITAEQWYPTTFVSSHICQTMESLWLLHELQGFDRLFCFHRTSLSFTTFGESPWVPQHPLAIHRHGLKRIVGMNLKYQRCFSSSGLHVGLRGVSGVWLGRHHLHEANEAGKTEVVANRRHNVRRWTLHSSERRCVLWSLLLCAGCCRVLVAFFKKLKFAGNSVFSLKCKKLLVFFSIILVNGSEAVAQLECGRRGQAPSKQTC